MTSFVCAACPGSSGWEEQSPNSPVQGQLMPFTCLAGGVVCPQCTGRCQGQRESGPTAACHTRSISLAPETRCMLLLILILHVLEGGFDQIIGNHA